MQSVRISRHSGGAGRDLVSDGSGAGPVQGHQAPFGEQEEDEDKDGVCVYE